MEINVRKEKEKRKEKETQSYFVWMVCAMIEGRGGSHQEFGESARN